MSLERSEKEKYVYFTYARQSYKDVDQFKTALSAEMSVFQSDKDIIIDFGACKYLTSPEIGTLVRLANGLKGSMRIVRVIPCEELHRQLSSINLIALEHLIVYKSREEFADQLKMAQQK